MSKKFIGYIMAGENGLEETKQQMRKLESCGIDILEIGLPFSDPVGDGPVIQKAGEKALKNGINLDKVFQMLSEVRTEVTYEIVIMSYLNPIFAYGVDRASQKAKEVGVSGFIIPDLTNDPSHEIRQTAKNYGLYVVSFLALTSPEIRKETVAIEAEGFIYAVSLKGVTGASLTSKSELQDHLASIKKYASAPVYAGFGIRSKEDIEEILPYCDGVIIGTKLMENISEGKWEEIKELVNTCQEFSGLTNQIK